MEKNGQKGAHPTHDEAQLLPQAKSLKKRVSAPERPQGNTMEGSLAGTGLLGGELKAPAGHQSPRASHKLGQCSTLPAFYFLLSESGSH